MYVQDILDTGALTAIVLNAQIIKKKYKETRERRLTDHNEDQVKYCLIKIQNPGLEKSFKELLKKTLWL